MTKNVLNEMEEGLEIMSRSVYCESIYNFFLFLPPLMKSSF